MTARSLAPISIDKIWDETRRDWCGSVFAISYADRPPQEGDALIVVTHAGNRTLRTFQHDARELRSACARALDAIQTLQRLECA